MLLVKNANVYAPENIGMRDLLIAGERIVAISERGMDISADLVQTIDLDGRMLCPGFIDNHVHTLGGGGGLGLASRAPELHVSQLTRTGTTSVIGMLGFDATTKNMASLVARTKGFWEEGISAYCLTGATLEHPVPTLTGRLRTDIVFVNEIIGVGEISVSELGYGYDSLGKGAQYIAEAATEALLAGRLSRKRGFLCLQVPPYVGECLKALVSMLKKTGLPIQQFIPSHVNQTDEYMADAINWGKLGGWVDVGANYSPDNNYQRATKQADAVAKLIEGGVPSKQILISSDGNGAPPKEERGEGQPRTANYMPLSALFNTWRRIVRDNILDLPGALSLVTSNVAAATGLSNKGRIAVGADADLLVLSDTLELETVIARGTVVVDGKKIVKRGMFEETILSQLG
jgi:beta-aspartyl-dipeptidase (metallo-type)